MLTNGAPQAHPPFRHAPQHYPSPSRRHHPLHHGTIKVAKLGTNGGGSRRTGKGQVTKVQLRHPGNPVSIVERRETPPSVQPAGHGVDTAHHHTPNVALGW